MSVSLDQIQSGNCNVESVNCKDQEVKRRFLEMGFCNNCSVEVCKNCKTLMICELRGYKIAIRKEDAKDIIVTG